MHDDRPSVRRVRVRRVPDEGDEGERVQRDAVVGPGSEVVLVHGALRAHLLVALALLRRVGLALLQEEGAERVRGEHVLAEEGHRQVAERLRARLGPVEVAFGLGIIRKVVYIYVRLY